MSRFAPSIVLGLSLLAGASLAAYAQSPSESIAALPPGATAAAPPAPIGPTGAYPGPDPGRFWNPGREGQTRPVEASPKYVGPDPGGMWSREEKQTQPVQPSPVYIGPAMNSDRGSDD